VPREDLEALSSKELHDRAVKTALKRLDVRFLWNLIESVPAAEAAVGKEGDAEADVWSLSARVNDLAASGEGEVADALRPLYLDYLEKHG
jgi:hypothetical protein